MKFGDRVYWRNDPDQRPWFVIRAREDSQFAYITDNIKLYPKTDAHAVPKGCLSSTPYKTSASAQSPTPAPHPPLPPSGPTVAPPATCSMHPDRYLPPAPAGRPKRAEKPAIKVPGGLDLNGLKAFAATLGLGSHDMEEIHRIWDTPAPNKPMRTMRVHNYIKNAYYKLED